MLNNKTSLRLLALSAGLICMSLLSAGIEPAFWGYGAGFFMGIFVATAEWKSSAERWRILFHRAPRRMAPDRGAENVRLGQARLCSRRRQDCRP